jgi:hypothetical protein
MNATRDEAGRWNVSGESESPSYKDALVRQLNALDPVFAQARAKCEFEFILTLLRIRGASVVAWDPYETTLRAIPKVEVTCREADVETQKHVSLWLYGHILEANEPYELLANLVRVAGGARFSPSLLFPREKTGRLPGPGTKIRRLQQLAKENGLDGAFGPLADIWDRDLRNAAFHADYSVTRDGLRILNPPTRYTWERFDALVNGALAYHKALSVLYLTVHVGSYTEPVTIPVHPGFSRDPDERAVVIVRQGYGVVGLKDAWSVEELKRGKISHLIGHFTEEEARLLNADPTRALLPPSNAD